jgi:hypothetical protein
MPGRRPLLPTARRDHVTVLLAQRLRSQWLTGPPARDPVAVASRLLAIQAQDPRGARLAIRARSSGLSAGVIDRAIDAGELIVTWLNRGTLHMVAAEDEAWLHTLTAPTLATACARRLQQEGVAPAQVDRGVAVIARELADGPVEHAELRERLERRGVPTAGQAFVHLLLRATIDGTVVRGPVAPAMRPTWVLRADWIGHRPRVDRDRALAELARRYLAGHGPASDRDLARWAGLPLRDARAGLTAVAGAINERPDGLLELAGAPRPRALPPPRLLGTFEPLLLGWASRDQVLGPHEPRIVSGGTFRKLILVDGRAAGTWSLRDGEAVLDPFEVPSAPVRAALERDAAAVARFMRP